MTQRYSLVSVDDSAAMLSIVANYLRDSEFDIVGTAQDGATGVELVQELEPQLVLLDLVMPGLTGQEALAEIIKVKPNAVVAIVSSLGFDDGVEECLATGAKSFLRKPFAKEDLLAFLRALTDHL